MEEQRNKLLSAMIEGRFFGTIGLDRAHAARPLSDIRRKAEPAEERTYLLKGKDLYFRWRSSAVANIVHMVAGQLPDAPPELKAFRVYRTQVPLVTMTGSVGARNDVRSGGLFHRWAGAAHLHRAEFLAKKVSALVNLVGQAAPRAWLQCSR